MKGFWNSKTDNEVFNAIKVESLSFIGKFKKFSKISFFDNVRNLDYSPVLNLKSNIDERNFVKVQILNKSNTELKPNTYYKITALVIPQKARNYHESEFLFQFTNESTCEPYLPNEKEFTELVFKKYSEANTANSQDILKSVKTITYQINKRNETFIYELLQNADDYPLPKEKVTVNFYVTDKYLLFTHSGAVFNFNNVYSLCAVNAEDKVDELDKIGFKGIGFKSVFKANEFVYLKSGNYSFRFDKAFHHAEYPWQLMPIWTDTNVLEVSLRNNNRFLNSNVAIALKPRNANKTLTEYSETLQLFSDERILLFLRNVEKVNVFLNNDKKIFCSKNESKWWLKYFEIEVTPEITEFLNNQISEGNEEVPSKFANLKSCKISFAALISNHQISALADGKLFNYLPLSINLSLPFLINSDFIPDGEREGLINNKWNEFLLIETGKQFAQFIRETVSDSKREKKFCYSILNLIPSFSTISETLKTNEKWSSYFHSFKTGFESSLATVQFIPIQKGGLETLSNILIDETKLSELLGNTFKELTGIKEEKIHEEVGDGLVKIKALISDYKLGRIFTSSDLKASLKTEIFQAWLKIPENNFKLLNHLFTSPDVELRTFLETEKIVLSESGELSKAEELFKSIPEEVLFIIKDKINSTLKGLVEKNNVELKTKPFVPTDFLNTYKSNINPLLVNELHITDFWNFIYDNWNELKENTEIKKALSSYNILCKPIKEGELNIKPVSAAYLSKEFAKDDEVESIIDTLKLKNKFFIESKFETEQRPNQNLQWNEILSGAKKGLFAVMNELIPQLKELEDSLHFKACIEIYGLWSKNKDKPDKQFTIDQFSTIKQTLKLKCGDAYYLASQCIIPEYYSGDKRISEIMPSIILKSQISSEYQPKEKLVSEWKQFFVLIGSKDLNSEQLVFNSKLDFLLLNQAQTRDNHFAVIKEMDSLFTANESKEVKLVFDFINRLSKLQLLSSTKEVWKTPNEIHFPSEYKPELDLQGDNELESGVFDFLSQEYFSNDISKPFLLQLGVKGNFDFILSTPGKYHFYPTYLITNKKYLKQIWNFITEFEIRVKQFALSNILDNVRGYDTVEVSENIFCKPSSLYSKKLSEYIKDRSLIPKLDLTLFFTDAKNTVTLEQIIGVNQELNLDQCLSLLKRERSLTQKEVSDLKLVSVIQRNNISSEKLVGIKLPSNQYKWMPQETLFTSTDIEIAGKYPDNLLHVDFNSVATKLYVRSISKGDYEFHFDREPDSNADSEIKNAITERAEYLAFALRDGSTDYLNTSIQITNSIIALTFIKCYEMSFSISHGNMNWKKELSFYPNGSEIYFLDEIQTKKSELRKWLYQHISKFGSIKQTAFERIVFDATEKAVIEDFKDYENIPESWLDKIRGGYKKEVEDFILTELENTEWSEYIPELKNILELSISHPKEKQKLYNLIAKLKLAKHKGIHFDKAEKDFNHLENGADKYFVHSARGSFAYIHPNEILRMKSDGYKMALDFGAKSPIKIYNTPEEILKLNTSHLLSYQYEKTIDDLFAFCEANKDANKHLLIIDKDNSKEKSKEIFKLLNPEDDYQ